MANQHLIDNATLERMARAHDRAINEQSVWAVIDDCPRAQYAERLRNERIAAMRAAVAALFDGGGDLRSIASDALNGMERIARRAEKAERERDDARQCARETLRALRGEVEALETARDERDAEIADLKARLDAVLPCSVRVPPDTTFSPGTPVKFLLLALDLRRDEVEESRNHRVTGGAP